MIINDKSNNNNERVLEETKSKYTFLEVFIVIIFITSQSLESSLLNIILGLCIFYYIHNKLAIVDRKIEELSNLVRQNNP